MSGSAGVRVRRDGAVVHLTLDHPERRNALSVAMTDRLLEALTEVAAREEDRVVILRGTGDAFCAGADLTEAAGFPTPLAYMHRVGELVATMHELPKPTIALLTGPAVGIGANLALACDLVVASERAELCEIFSRRGLSLDGGGSWLLPRLAGLQHAKRIAFFGHRVSAREAEVLGLVSRVIDHDHAEAFATEWATELAGRPSQALALTKAELNASFQRSLREALDAEALSQVANFHHPDFTTRLSMFLARDSRAQSPTKDELS